jgi:hypothetical protein
VRGVKKHHTNYFAKSPCQNFFKKSTEISMSVPPRFCFVLSRFWMLLSDGSKKALKKGVFANTPCGKGS